MGTRTKKKWQKVAATDRFSIFRNKEERHLFEVSWKKSSGGYGRRRFSAESTETALERAPQVAGLVRPVREALPELTIADAFEECLSLAKRGPESTQDWIRDQLRFMRWLEGRYPECSVWSDISRRMIREYVAEEFEGRSPNRIRLAMQPLTQTGGHMAREYQIPNVAERLGIGSKLRKPPALVYLPDVLAFQDWIAEVEPRLEPAVALQGLAGLAVMEALRLTWDKVDLERGLVEISGEVKNEYRNRIIPVCSRVVEALIRARTRQSEAAVVQISAPVIQSPNGCSYAEGVRSWCNFGRDLRKRMREWNPQIRWAPKDLRNCLPTFSISEGLHGDLWEQYIGHAPRSVTARHYLPRLAAVSQGEAAALERQMNLFRLQVVKPLEKAISEQGGAEILNFFERREQKAKEAAEATSS